MQKCTAVNFLLISIALLGVVSAKEFILLGNFDLTSEAGNWEQLARIEANLEVASGYLQTDKLSLIPKEVFAAATASNRFIQLKLKDEEREYLTTIDLLSNFANGMYKEVIELNVDNESNLNSFSYVLKQESTKKSKKNLEIDEDIEESFRVVVNQQTESLKSIFSGSTNKARHQASQQQSAGSQNAQNAPKDQPPQEQGGIMQMIKDNFWYIVIALVVMNLAGGGLDPNKGAPAAGGAPAAAGAGAARSR